MAYGIGNDAAFARKIGWLQNKTRRRQAAIGLGSTIALHQFRRCKRRPSKYLPAQSPRGQITQKGQFQEERSKLFCGYGSKSYASSFQICGFVLRSYLSEKRKPSYDLGSRASTTDQQLWTVLHE